MAQTYRVSGTLQHGVVLDEPGPDGSKVRVDVYRDGDEFSTEDAALERELRASKTILLPEEYAAEAAAAGNPQAQQQLAAERQAQADEIARLRAELEALKAGQQGSSEPPKSGGEE